jgi:hypothetical protein
MNLTSLLSACILTLGLASAQLPSPGTETIHSVFHVKAGHEAEYAQLSGKAWALYQRLGLVLDKPHIVLRGSDEKGRPYFVEIFTWKSSDIPEHVPADVKAIWQQLEAVCEPRDGRRGIDFAEVAPLQLE